MMAEGRQGCLLCEPNGLELRAYCDILMRSSTPAVTQVPAIHPRAMRMAICLVRVIWISTAFRPTRRSRMLTVAVRGFAGCPFEHTPSS